MANKKLVIPSFGNEDDEAAWWENHRAAVESDLRVAMRSGVTLSLSDVMARGRSRKEIVPVTIGLASEDLETTRELASDNGIGYQAYIKLLLHDALRTEAERRTCTGK
jgi:hypothetical protein